jgi:hypothetical protein
MAGIPGRRCREPDTGEHGERREDSRHRRHEDQGRRLSEAAVADTAVCADRWLSLV